MSTNGIHEDTPWVKAKKSDGGGNCLEFRGFRNMVEFRDTKASGQGPTLTFTRAEMGAFVAGAKDGEFDHLI